MKYLFAPLIFFVSSYSLYNSIYSPKYEESYKKTHLVHFGEYIPFIHSLRGLISFFDLPMSNVSHGSKSQKNITILDGIKVSTPGRSKRDPGQLQARTICNRIVNFSSNDIDLVGKMINININEALPNCLRGNLQN